jgi:hypothetical protein
VPTEATSNSTPQPGRTERSYDGLAGGWRKAIGISAILGWAGLMGVSLTANATFAASFGSSHLESMLLGGAAVASDMFKALTPIAFFYFIFHSRWWPAASAATLFSVAMLFSVVASLGFVATERFSAFDKANHEMTTKKNAEADAKKLEDGAKWIPKASRPASVIAADIAARNADRTMQITLGCTKTTPSQETWCRETRQLQVELATAEEATRVEGKIEGKRDTARKIMRSEGDYQAGMLASMLGLDTKTIIYMMIGLTVLLIETGSAFGLTIGIALLAGGVSGLNMSRLAFGKSAREARAELEAKLPPMRVEPLTPPEPDVVGAVNDENVGTHVAPQVASSPVATAAVLTMPRAAPGVRAAGLLN